MVRWAPGKKNAARVEALGLLEAEPAGEDDPYWYDEGVEERGDDRLGEIAKATDQDVEEILGW